MVSEVKPLFKRSVSTETPEMMQELNRVSGSMLEEWNQNKTVSKQASWVHENAW
jgi:hypothetical protein